MDILQHGRGTVIKTPAKAIIGITKNHPRTFTGKGDIGEGVSFPVSLCYEQSTGGSGILHISGTVATNSQSSNFTFIRISKINTVLGLTFAVNPAVKIGSWAEPSGTVDTGYGACCEISAADGGFIGIGRIYTTGGDYGNWPASILSGKTFTISIPITEVTQSTPRIYWDVPPERIHTQPVVNIAENEGGGFEFTLTNDYEDPTGNVLSEMFGLWNDSSTGPLRPGMFVALSHDTWQNRVTEGRISEIIAGDRTVTVRVADFNSLMGTQGQTLFRNYHGGYVSNQRVSGEWNSTENKLEILDLPSDAIVQSNAAEWGVPRSEAYVENGSAAVGSFGNTGYLTVNTTFSYDRVSSVKIKADWQLSGSYSPPKPMTGIIIFGNISVSVTDGVTIQNAMGSFSAAGLGSASNSGSVELEVFGDFAPNLIITINTYKSTTSGTNTSIYCTAKTYTFPGSTVAGVADKTTAAATAGIDYKEATGTRSGSSFFINSINGVASINSSLYVPGLRNNHARISYTSGTVGVHTIIDQLAKGIGYIPQDLSTGSITLKEFRAGGGYLLDYLKVLTDLYNPNTLPRSFRGYGEPGKIPELRIGNRNIEPSVTEDLKIIYGNGNDAQILRHSPIQTIIDRPTQIMARTKTDSVPIIVTMTDWTAEKARSIGTVKYAEGDEMSSFGDSVRKAWGSLKANDIWEGTVTVSGIYTGLISAYGRGATVSITDPRYAMTDYHVIVKSVRLDYGQQTTEITYGNLGQEYGNKLKDGSAMALFSANRAVDAQSSEALYATQYVRIVSQTPVPVLDDGDNTFRIPNAEKNGPVTLTGDQVMVIRYPDGERALFCLAVKASMTYYTDEPNDVASVICNGIPHLIPEDLRPDLYKGQTLIVNLDVPIDN
jgi:hypothetical protein